MTTDGSPAALDAAGDLDDGDGFFRTLFDQNHDALFLHADDGRILRVNARVPAMFGWTVEEAVGLSIADLSADVPPFTRAGAVAHLDKALRAGSCIFEWQCRHRDGTTFWSEIALRSFTMRGRPLILACVRDIVRRKSTESALRASEQRFATIFHNLSSLLAFTDPADGVIVDINETWLRATGLAREEVVGRTGRALNLWTNIAERDGIVADVLARGQVRDFETTLQMRGQTLPVLISAELVTLDDRRYILWEVRDISDTKRMEGEREKLRAQLLQSQKMESIGRLAGGISHDFNNLLTVINGCAHLLLQALDKQDPNFDLAVDIQRAGQRAAGLTQQLLAFSRRQVMRPRALSLNSLVPETEHLLRRLIGEDIDLLVLLDPALHHTFADPNSIHQVLMNLAVNARDAMPSGGRLTIETRNIDTPPAPDGWPGKARPGRFVRLAVSDTGVGMDDATQRRLFEPFFTTKPQGKGTGLGLSTVYGIVEQSGGYITVYSEVGVGTTFMVHLPMLSADATPEHAETAEAVQTRRHETVLLVEDQPEVRRFAARVLEDLGYRVLDAQSGEEALERLARHEGPLDVLLTDVVLSGISGRTLSEQVAARQPGLKVIFMSGYTDDVVVRHGVLARSAAFLQKPFSPSRLSQVLRDSLDRG